MAMLHETDRNNKRTNMVSLDWARSLVGRDWEIWWNDEEENKDETEEVNVQRPSMNDATTTTKITTATTEIGPIRGTDHHHQGDVIQESGPIPMVVDRQNSGQRSSSPVAPEKSTNPDAQPKDDDKNGKNNQDGEVQSDSEGSIIDDWYAGRVLKMTQQADNVFMFKILFVGDDEIYEMELIPSKVRPSSRGWIKRTKCLLSSEDMPPDEQMLPDTGTDRDELTLLETEYITAKRAYQEFCLPEQAKTDTSIRVPDRKDLETVLRLRYLLKSQIYLRSRLAKIESHAGSSKYVGGERNPTESYVNHLLQCCKDLEHVCTWFCQCWELLTTAFPIIESTRTITDNENIETLTIDHVLAKYLECGKNSIWNCLTLNTEAGSTPSRRRRPIALIEDNNSAIPSRQSKRRKKMGSSDSSFLEESKASSSGFVKKILSLIKQNSTSSFLHRSGEMMQTVSHFIVEPALQWKTQASLCLGESGENDGNKQKRKQKDAESMLDQVSSDEESEEDDTIYYTFEEIESLVDSLATVPVLRKLNWSVQKTQLEKKLDLILATERKARDFLCRVADGDGDTSKNDDVILKSLGEISESSIDFENQLFNVDPIGKSLSPVTREVLQGAIQLRTWLLDVRHTEHVRERALFLEGLATRLMDLPDLSDVPEIHNNAFVISRLQASKKRVTTLVSHSSPELESMLKDPSILSSTNPTHTTIEGVDAALVKLRKESLILNIEEKLCIRRDIILWEKKARSILSRDGTVIEFAQLDNLNTELQSIIKGRSKSRMQGLKNVYPNCQVEREVESFAVRDAMSIGGGSLAQLVSELHSTASQWKIRSISIVSSLRMHGNCVAGEALIAQKLPPMVDIKRINDLILEYNNMQVDIPQCITVLENVQKNTLAWAKGMNQKTIEEELSIDKCLPFFVLQRERRPKGIIMDPTRHVVDSLVDVLAWYERVKKSLRDATLSLSAASTQDSRDKYSIMIVDSFYPLLAEGIEIVELFTKQMSFDLTFQCSTQRCLQILEDLYGIRKSTKTISLEKLQSHPLGSSILSRVVGFEADMKEGSPMFMMIWYYWNLLVDELMARCAPSSFVGGSGKKTTMLAKSASLVEAKKLKDLQPILTDAMKKNFPCSMIFKSKTPTIESFDTLISSAESAEFTMQVFLSKSKELFKAGIQEADLVKEHLSNLKDSHITFKTRASSRECLTLDPYYEPRLDRHVKIFAWLVRTFGYPFLHLDEASFNAPVDVESRVPWGVLVSLNERIPYEHDEHTGAGAFALVSLRIRELYEAGRKWQDEITRNTVISLRGGKKRGGTQSKLDQEVEASSKLQLEKMMQLAEHPILSKVAMPREKAVNGILKSSREFETLLHDLMGQDYEGMLDRSVFPSSDSLVGDKGEFVLFRLTGSPLYDELQARMHDLSQVGDNVLAETPGKAAFEWIRKAVVWIESLSHAVTTESPFKCTEGKLLSIPCAQAETLVEDGEAIFLDLPEDLKRTLSKHGISLSTATNKQEKTIKVLLKKDDSHHSCGKVALRWCPILFDCLKADVAKLNIWEKSLNKIVAQFQAFFPKSEENRKKNGGRSTEEDLYAYFTFEKQVAALLENAQESLIISPETKYVASQQNLLKAFRTFLEKGSSAELNQKFFKRWYLEKSTLLSDRSFLLDSLLYRKSIFDYGRKDILIGDSFFDISLRTFRDACRSRIEMALNESLKICSLTLFPEVKNLESFCATKAWEIEGLMFELYQDGLGTSRISEDYRDKARSLRCSLEDKNNISLCFRVLLGDLDTATLLSMSPENLSSQKAKHKRPKAEQAIKQQALLAPGYSETSDDLKKPIVREPDQDVSGVGPVCKQDIARVKNTVLSERNNGAQISTFKKLASEKPRNDESSVTSLKSLTMVPKVYRPPAPPSLASKSFQQQKDAPLPLDDSSQPLATGMDATSKTASSSRDRGKRFLSLTGSDRFHIEISKLKLAFSAAFYLEDESLAGVHSFVPATLIEKGRLKVEEFSRFVSDKLSGGRWAAIPLRLTVLSDHDDRIYKQFYKEYEVQKRIAMFKLGQNTKVFLVTPKFHGAAKSTGYIALPNKTSTYAIILTKEKLFVD